MSFFHLLIYMMIINSTIKATNSNLESYSFITKDTVMFSTLIDIHEPTAEPTAEPSDEPTAEQTAEPTTEPTAEPTAEPTTEPTTQSTLKLTSINPTMDPTIRPSSEPSAKVTQQKTSKPSIQNPASFSFKLTFDFSHSINIGNKPTVEPSIINTFEPSLLGQPTLEPSSIGTFQIFPSILPTVEPISASTFKPSILGQPTLEPSSIGTFQILPTVEPISASTFEPSILEQPTLEPSTIGTFQIFPSILPTFNPSIWSSFLPSSDRTIIQSMVPSADTIMIVSTEPNILQTISPSIISTEQTSLIPTILYNAPSKLPAVSSKPSLSPTAPVYPTLSFTSNLTLNGLSQSILDETAQLSIRSATASSMSISIDCERYMKSITIFPSSRRQINQFIKDDSYFKDQAVVTYSIISIVETTIILDKSNSINNPNDLYFSLVNLLTDNVKNGIFSKFLKSASALYGSIVTANASCNSVTSSKPILKYIPIINNNDDITAITNDHQTNKLSTSLIIIISISSLFILISGIALIFYYNYYYIDNEPTFGSYFDEDFVFKQNNNCYKRKIHPYIDITQKEITL